MKYLNVILFCWLSFFMNGQKVYDQSSVESTTNALLDIISVDQGEEPDWDGFRSLFIPTAQFVFVNEAASPHRRTQSFNLEEFIRYIGPGYAKDGFTEISTGLVVNQWNGIATAYQSYTAKNLIGTYEETGINNYQMVQVNGKWYVASLTWANANAENPIPAKYLD